MRWACKDGKQGVNFLGRICVLLGFVLRDTEHTLAELGGVGQGAGAAGRAGGRQYTVLYRKTVG